MGTDTDTGMGAGAASTVLLTGAGFSAGIRSVGIFPAHIVAGARARSCKNSALPAVARKSAMMAINMRRARTGVMAA